MRVTISVRVCLITIVIQTERGRKTAHAFRFNIQKVALNFGKGFGRIRPGSDNQHTASVHPEIQCFNLFIRQDIGTEVTDNNNFQHIQRINVLRERIGIEFHQICFKSFPVHKLKIIHISECGKIIA